MDKNRFISTALRRGYGNKQELEEYVKRVDPREEYTEEDLVEASRWCSYRESLQPNPLMDYCRITPEDATLKGIPNRSGAYPGGLRRYWEV